MDKNLQTWYFLLSSLLVVIAMFAFAIIVFIQYRKKKTLGTLFLTFIYLDIAIAEILNNAGLWYYAFNLETNKIGGYLQLSFLFFYSLAYITQYFFANRHILNDNDFVKYMISTFITIIITVLTTLMVVEFNIDALNPMYIKFTILNGPNLIQLIPSTLTGIIVFLPIFTLVHLRIIIGTFRLQKQATDIVTKRGLRLIGFSFICFILSALFASLFVIPNIESSAIANFILHTLRITMLMLGILFGYFGWVMPDFIKKRFLKNENKI